MSDDQPTDLNHAESPIDAARIASDDNRLRIEQFSLEHRTALLVQLFTDMVDSTRLSRGRRRVGLRNWSNCWPTSGADVNVSDESLRSTTLDHAALCRRQVGDSRGPRWRSRRLPLVALLLKQFEVVQQGAQQ